MGRDWVRAFIGLGANAGDPMAQIEQAMAALMSLPATVGLQRSRLYRTAPWQAQGPDFINAMVQLETQLSAPELWVQMQRIEQAAGRIRPYHHAPRTCNTGVPCGMKASESVGAKKLSVSLRYFSCLFDLVLKVALKTVGQAR